MDETTATARQQVVDARAGFLREVDELEAATRSALDVPARIRRDPTRWAAGVGGVAFVALGGPQRLVRRLRRGLRGGKDPAPSSVLPDEIERIVEGLGESASVVRARLDREFADYLASQKRQGRLRSNAAATFWRGANMATTVFAANAAGQLARRLFSADRDRPPPTPRKD